jgi:hypothetical protein
VIRGRGTADVGVPRAEVVHAVGRNASQPGLAGISIYKENIMQKTSLRSAGGPEELIVDTAADLAGPAPGRYSSMSMRPA